MERKEARFIGRSDTELGHVADLLLYEYESESTEALFDLLDELKKEHPSEDIAEHFADWSRAERIALQNALFWKLDEKKRKQYQKRLK